MSNDLNFYINGEWVKSESNELIDVINPANEEVIGQVTAGTKEDIDLAVSAAFKAFSSYQQTTKEQRVELLNNIITEYENRYDDFVQTITKEMGSPLWLSEAAQAKTGIKNIHETLDALKNYEFEKPEGDYTIIKEPIGVIGMITPWNWPMNQITTKVSAALAAGCTMVLKPSEISPYCAMLLAEVFDSAGVPNGVFNVVNGYGPTVGAALSEHPDVAMMSFTGSTRGGVAVAQAAAKSVKRVSQELGGKSPNIIFDDEKFEQSVTVGVQKIMENTGQSCNAPTRMIVPKNRQNEALEIAKNVAEKLITGDPTKEKTDIGPLVSQAQFDKVQRLIESGIKAGAQLVTGGLGKPIGLNAGYFVKPTVFGDVKNSMEIAQEEIFGPVLSVIPYEDIDNAVQIANDTSYGLSAYVCGSDPRKLRSVARQIRAGQIHVNYGSGGTNAPFGGFKQSGNGREKAEWGLEEFLETKAIME